MNALAAVKELAQYSQGELIKTANLAKQCKRLCNIAGVIEGAVVAANLFLASDPDNDSKTKNLATAGLMALPSIISFNGAFQIGKIQKMINIASKYCAIA